MQCVLVNIFACALCCSSGTKLYPPLYSCRYFSSPGFPVLCLSALTKTRVLWVRDAIQPSRSLLSSSLPAFNLPHHQGLFNESVLLIRWPKYWCFNFSISPSSEYSGLISFRNDWFDLFPVQEILRFYYERHSEMFRQSLLKAILTRRVFYHWTFCWRWDSILSKLDKLSLLL